MDINKFYCIDALLGLQQVPDASVTLCLTSPPYADLRSKSYPTSSVSQYVSWFLPIAQEILRTLAPTGSFVLNIGDKIENGERSTYCMELVLELKKLGFKFIDEIIWVKKNGVPNAGRRRANQFEHIFHFAKDLKPVWNPDPIRTPYAASSVSRAKKPIKCNVSNRESRKSSNSSSYKKWNLHSQGAYPKNVLSFKKDSGKNHPASFSIELPLHFIRAHSNPGDLVVDPFAGRGTTLEAARMLDRNYLGFDICQNFVNLGKELYGLTIS